MKVDKKVVALVFAVIIILSSLLIWSVTRPVEEPPEELTVDDLVNSQSVRSTDATSLLVADDSVYLTLTATPLACNYNQDERTFHPMIVEDKVGKGVQNFFDLYKDEITTIGRTESGLESTQDFNIGTDTEVSVAVAKHYWYSTDTVIIIQPSNETFGFALAATLLSSYVNIPVIIAEEWDSTLDELMKTLTVKNSIIVGDLPRYGKSINFNCHCKVENFTLDYMMKRFGTVEYITVTNSIDAHSEGYGIPKISSIAPYLTASHKGMLLPVKYERLPEDIFTKIGNDDEGKKNMEIINNITIGIDTELQTLLTNMDDRGLLSGYLTNSPYLALLGDCYSVPFYYKMDEANRQIATDDLYSSIDEDIYHVELASGRPIGLTRETTSLLISRSIIYSELVPNVEPDSRIANTKNDPWCDNAYVAKGDDYNIAIWVMTPEIYEEAYYLYGEGYNIYFTKRRETSKSVSQELLKLYTSSSMIYIFAHGSPSGYQIIDGVSYSDVRNWDMGPSVLILTSCSAARIDIGDITTTISLNFIDSGVNAYFGGMRTEYTGPSPYMGMDIMESLVSEDLSVGIANRDAKNLFMENYDQTEYYHSGIRQVYADPTFNPYEP